MQQSDHIARLGFEYLDGRVALIRGSGIGLSPAGRTVVVQEADQGVVVVAGGCRGPADIPSAQGRCDIARVIASVAGAVEIPGIDQGSRRIVFQ